MRDDASQHANENHSGPAFPSGHVDEIADAVAEMLSENGLEIRWDDALIIANQLVESFRSPLMRQRAAGATSEVSVVNSPTGGVESARSRKIANVLYNLKSAALAMPVPALAGKFVEHNTPASLRITLGAITALFGFLNVAAAVLNITLTKQAAAILQVMWVNVAPGTDMVWQAGLLEKVNSQFERLGWNTIDAEELISNLEALEKIGCLQRETNYNSISLDRIRWQLKEEVRVSFKAQ